MHHVPSEWSFSKANGVLCFPSAFFSGKTRRGPVQKGGDLPDEKGRQTREILCAGHSNISDEWGQGEWVEGNVPFDV